MWNILKTIVETMFRTRRFPVETGLRKFGHPTADAPVLVTTNFDLTVRRVSKILKDHHMDCYLLVAPARGINVWCAAGGGHFSADSVISVIKTSGINELVHHRKMILPQLSACGLSRERIEESTGWKSVFGPVYARDIPEYIKHHFRKTREMRRVRFDRKQRFEMAVALSTFTSLWLLIPTLIFWRSLWLQTVSAVWLLTFVILLLEDHLPFKDLFAKGMFVGIVADVIVLGYFLFVSPMPILSVMNWGIGLFALAVFIGIEAKGFSPLVNASVHTEKAGILLLICVSALIVLNLAKLIFSF